MVGSFCKPCKPSLSISAKAFRCAVITKSSCLERFVLHLRYPGCVNGHLTSRALLWSDAAICDSSAGLKARFSFGGVAVERDLCMCWESFLQFGWDGGVKHNSVQDVSLVARCPSLNRWGWRGQRQCHIYTESDRSRFFGYYKYTSNFSPSMSPSTRPKVHVQSRKHRLSFVCHWYILHLHIPTIFYKNHWHLLSKPLCSLHHFHLQQNSIAQLQ